jgi:hypothetical protein
MSQVLHLTNGNTLNAKIEASGNRVGHMLAADDGAIVDDLYLAALSRLPTPAERQKLTAALAQVEESDRLPSLAELRQKIAGTATEKDAAARREALKRVEERIREIPGESVRMRRKAIEDLYWSVLSSKEFLFNH